MVLRFKLMFLLYFTMNGLLFLSVQAQTVFREVNGIICMEAEHYANKGGFTEVDNTNASGGKAMKVGSGSLSFTVDVTSGGTWYLYTRALAADDTQNSIQAKLNGNSLKALSGDTNAGQNRMYLGKLKFLWNSYWQGLSHGGRSWPIEFQMQSGTQTIAITQDRSAQPLIDKVVLSKSKIDLGKNAPSNLPGYGAMGPDETDGSGATVIYTQQIDFVKKMNFTNSKYRIFTINGRQVESVRNNKIITQLLIYKTSGSPDVLKPVIR